MSDFLIVGGGVIGLLMARELAKEGATVTVVDSGECCREASWAGGGIVSPLYPWRYSPAVTALASCAQERYPALASELLDETGVDPELEVTGLLMLDAQDSDEALLWGKSSKRIIVEREAKELASQEPHLAKRFKHGLWMPEIANIRNPRLGQALRRSALLDPRVTVLEHTSIKGFVRREDRLLGVVAEQGSEQKELKAGEFIVAAGAWSGNLLSQLNIELPVEPVKGQMLLFRPPQRLLNSIVLSAGRYLIPRRDGHLLVGSTLEHAQFDKSTTEEALQSLLESATGLVPELNNYPVVKQWAGLRPGAPEGIPYIGRVHGFSNLSVNAGQYRNGLVLAPASASLLASILLNKPSAIDASPYSLQRKAV
ncbi:MAG: glycine oxidase ThiO [Pseudohongiellaceae bacterium]|nr:glycine oxidase ThiO [Pseudohongiellaceae bacterium]